MLRCVEYLSETRTPAGEVRVSANEVYAGRKSDFLGSAVMYVCRESLEICWAHRMVMSGNRR
jgi:hypothetical protein